MNGSCSLKSLMSPSLCTEIVFHVVRCVFNGNENSTRGELRITQCCHCLLFFSFQVCFNELNVLKSYCVQQGDVWDTGWVYWLPHLFLEISALLTPTWKPLSSAPRMWGTLWAIKVKILPGPLKHPCLLCLPEQSSGDKAVWSQLLKTGPGTPGHNKYMLLLSACSVVLKCIYKF